MKQKTYNDIRCTRILIRGAGDLASGIAHRLCRSGFRVCLVDTATPMAVRRMVAFSEAVYEGGKTIEGITAVRISRPEEISPVWEKGQIPLLIDPANEIRHTLKPHVLVDAILVSVARPQKEPERQFPDVSGASCSLQHERVRPAYAFSYKHFPWQDYPQQVQFEPNCGALVSLSEFKYLMASHCLFTRSSKLMKSKKLLFSRKTIKINFR